MAVPKRVLELIDLFDRNRDAYRQVDQLVYEVYGLTDEEIKIVEESTSK